MDWYDDAASSDRRRRLLGWSRFKETPRHRIIELSADGRDYVSLGDVEEEALRPVQALLRRVLEGARLKLTCADILAAWPPDEPKASQPTLSRALSRAVEKGEVKSDGDGVRGNPYYYWLPSLEERWKTDVMARLLQEQADAARNLRDQVERGFRM